MEHLATLFVVTFTTLLAVYRTALGCFIGGAGLLKFFGHPAFELAGIFLMLMAAVILGVGMKKYWSIKKLIGAIDPQDWQPLEAMIEKNRTP